MTVFRWISVQETHGLMNTFSTFNNLFSWPLFTYHFFFASSVLVSLRSAGNWESAKCLGCREVNSGPPAATEHEVMVLWPKAEDCLETNF